MNMTSELMLLGLAGIAIHYLKDWVIVNKQGKKYNLSASIPMMLLSIVTTLLLIYLREDIATLYVITPFGAVVLGYIGNSIFFSFVGAKAPKGIEQEPAEDPAETNDDGGGKGGETPPKPPVNL